ncbi:transmembrane protein 41B, variant [Capsaspora owczarzaki ATCC 30864]|uniref:Transmembrane protein 41B, variant n=1 Tax=Capsaspora owczarzaki (strain ATCC 30864) TaxID=595528 RepID=A0A0D2X0Q5_CAPO3|nr:transmembrane protein 41B, variant [Capsaspora owczarzaki ATCC 30864]
MDERTRALFGCLRGFTQVLRILALVLGFGCISLQTFAVPGSVFLSILAGTLFPFPLALALVCVCSATGASFCYLLSRQLGRQLVERAFPERLATWRAQVDRHRDNLFYYLFFLRVTPFVPNWFINAASPLIDMPLITFASSTFFGVIPLSLFHIQGGKLLNELTTTTPPLSAFLLSGGLGLIALLPTLFKNKLKERMD